MHPYKVAGIGEILWDILPNAKTLGGAPINFAYHVTALGARGIAVSTIGDDQPGREALQRLQAKGLDTSGISINQFPTGFVTAQIDDQGVATYRFPDEVAWDHLSLNTEAATCIPELHAACFGTLAQRSDPARAAIHHFINQLPETTLKVYDLNLRQHFYSKKIIEKSLNTCSILKLNDEECTIIATMFNLTGTMQEQLRQLLAHWQLKLIILTQGDKGSILITERSRSIHPGFPTKIVDTIGAGDAFTAATVVGLLLGRSLEEINERANRLASYVCGQPGGMPKIPQSLRYL
jgi:fructokinase